MPLPTSIQHRVAYIDVLTDNAFPGSVEYWRLPSDSQQRWTTVNAQSQAIFIGSEDALELDCDCDALIAAPNGGILHINGDVNSELRSREYCELVIGGNVSRNASIRASGFISVYIAGSVYGSIELSGSSRIWIDGDFFGSIATGDPSTHLVVTGNFVGTISSKNADTSLLYLCVDGFAANSLICSISTIGYAQFNGSIGSSDVDAGLYPYSPERRNNRWCVLTKKALPE